MKEYDNWVINYGSLYNTASEIVSNSIISRKVFLDLLTDDEICDDEITFQVEQVLYDIYKILKQLNTPEHILFNCWFKQCCVFAANVQQEIIDNQIVNN